MKRRGNRFIGGKIIWFGIYYTFHIDVKASSWRRPKSNMKNRFKIHSFDKCVLNEHNVPGTIFGHGNISMLSWSSQSVWMKI